MPASSAFLQGSFRSSCRRSLAVAVSGGVDSLCALILAKQAGFDVLALHALFCHDAGVPEERTIMEGLAESCAKLGVPLEVADLRAPFQTHVVAPFADAYLKGFTPNPCAACNRTMKFGHLLDRALALGADFMATGHYARLATKPKPASDEDPLLAWGTDRSKDQSYFLSLVPQARLAKVCFPLQAMTKQEGARLVQKAGLTVPASKESQDICFVPRQPERYREFLGSLRPEAGRETEGGATLLGAAGDIVLRSQGMTRRLGTHHGLWRYTEGQRQGLGIAWTEPLYVTCKDATDNILYVGTKQDAVMHGALVRDLNLMVAEAELPSKALVRLRYRQQPAPATIALGRGEEKQEALRLHIRLDAPSTLSAPGQTACVYSREGLVLAGGVIEQVF
ncbi:MAG: tRNA 2-thiouridine(34) synthase MnmA [Desulfovibrio sp.]|nr:tRNA 2-thiouridine(34) synthase MnmA [Desulfovibrio sp.]